MVRDFRWPIQNKEQFSCHLRSKRILARSFVFSAKGRFEKIGYKRSRIPTTWSRRF
jgi:hypothetical protein